MNRMQTTEEKVADVRRRARVQACDKVTLMTEKVEIGRYYQNIHTGRMCKVTGKIFYNIKFNEEGGVCSGPHYVHYKTFRKNWIKVPDREITIKPNPRRITI